jgi:hypothetical protein
MMDIKSDAETTSRDFIFMINCLWVVMENEFRYDYCIAVLVLMIWFRTIYYFRGFKSFGPMFRIMQDMVIDLS